MQVFLDTVGLLALWDRRDQWHEQAERAFVSVAERNDDLFTTSFVLAECANASSRRPYRNDPAELRTRLEADGRLIFPSAEDWDAAWSAYTRGEAGNAGLVDHLSFAVMRRVGIHLAFTNDRHFAAAGFETLF